MNTRRKTLYAIVAAFLVLAIIGCRNETDSAPSDIGASAIATMAAPDGTSMGTVTLRQGPNGLLVSVDMNGLTPGWHGFHIHETGKCSPDFSAAGGHHAVEDEVHGFMFGDYHAGDMPNIYVAADGTARADIFNTKATLDADVDESIFDANGSAIIVHAKPDTYGENAGAGDRASCGVIKPTN